MPCTLVSFIGTGRKTDDRTPGRYVTTQYRFADGQVVETDLFGAALLRHLETQGNTVDTWLLLGTKQSNWDVLNACVPDTQQIETPWLDVIQAIELGQVDQPMLDRWADALRDAGMAALPVLRMVGPCDTQDSQSALWAALLESIRDDTRVVMDITHGLRHQPVLATFMLGLLRSLRDIRLDGVYYGAFELKQGGAAPVLELAWCRQLFELTESLATMQHTGVITPMVTSLGLPASICGDLRKFAVLDDLMHPSASAEMAHRLVTELNRQSLQSPVHQALLPEMQKRMEEVSTVDRADHLINRAKNSMKRKSYSKALLELQEAIMSVVRNKYGIKDSESGNRQIKLALSYMNEPHSSVYKSLNNLRDGVAHGFTNERKISPKDIDEIGRLLNEGVKLYYAIKSGEIKIQP